MNRCPIIYCECAGKYSEEGLNLLSGNLESLQEIEYSAAEQRQEASNRATRMSIQGLQPKLSAVLNIRKAKFEIVDIHGRFILKPQHHIFPELPENEDLTMKMAAVIGIETPAHGLVYSKDGSLTYFIKRFDRLGKNNKLAVEDFAQLAGMTRNTKYNYSFENLIKIVENNCTFPLLEKARLFKRTLFNFLTGNEDMHLKNYSLITDEGKITLAPAYDFLNSTIVLSGDIEESALTINGKKKNLNKKIMIEYLGRERLGLTEKTISNVQDDIRTSVPQWKKLISLSFLSDENKDAYLNLMEKRLKLLSLD